MTNVFIITLRPILTLCKCLGIINTSYYLESNGLLTKNNSTYYSIFEFTKIILLMIFTYNIHKELILNEVLCFYKFWAVFIASRISETWIIKLINGIIEFDQKLTSLPTYLKARQLQRSFSKQCWNVIFICGFLYYIGTSLLIIYLWPILVMDFYGIFTYLIRVSSIVDFTVIISSFFFLRNLEYRFETLIDFWNCLPVELMAIPGECSNYDIAIMIDDIRLLHTELSDLLRIFSLGYGQILLGYFVFSYIEAVCIFYYLVCFEFKTTHDILAVKSFLQMVVPHMGNFQNVILTMAIVVSASRVNEKKRQIISYLRLTRISKLSSTIKIQIKMFMNQISVFESQEITAFGIFNINLNLVVSIIVLIVSGLVTLIQMKEHPFLLKIANDSKHAFIRRVLMHQRVYFNVSKINDDVK